LPNVFKVDKKKLKIFANKLYKVLPDAILDQVCQETRKANAVAAGALLSESAFIDFPLKASLAKRLTFDVNVRQASIRRYSILSIF
jgi:hypothetical protein